MTVWRTLFWKEWHEQKWKLLSLTVIIVSACLIGFLNIYGSASHSFFSAIYIHLFIAPIYLSIGVTTGELSDRSLEFQKALPCALWKNALIRLASNWLILILPIIFATMVSLCWMLIQEARGRLLDSFQDVARWQSHSPWIAVWVIALAGIGHGTYLYLWIITLTTNQRTELRAGVIGVIALIVAELYGAWGIRLNLDLFVEMSVISRLLFLASPACWTTIVVNDLNAMTILSFLIHGLLFTAATVAFARRYGNDSIRSWPAVLKRCLPQWKPEIPALGPARASRWRALFWMQLQETLPLTFAGIIVVGVISRLAVWGMDVAIPNEFLLNSVLICVLGVVLGTSPFVQDFETKLHTFWRSRPISPEQWFFLKYVAGLFVLLIVVDAPLIVIRSYFGTEQVSTENVALVLALHTLIYSIAVFAACGVRHPIYSPILAICATLMMVILVQVATLVFSKFYFIEARHFFDASAIYAMTGVAIVISFWATMISAILTTRNISLNQ